MENKIENLQKWLEEHKNDKVRTQMHYAKQGVITPHMQYVAKIEKAHVGVSFERILVIADALGINYLTLMHCPDETAIEILKDIYDDLEIDVSKHEFEILWNQSFFKDSDATLENYVKILDLCRGESSTKNEAQLVVARDDEPKEKAYYQIRMEKKANKG